MYKIEIEFEQKNKAVSKLNAYEVINKDTTKFEKATGSILKDYVEKTLKEFNEEFKKDNNMDSYDNLDDVLKDLLDDLLDDLKNLKETMKDKKKED